MEHPSTKRPSSSSSSSALLGRLSFNVLRHSASLAHCYVCHVAGFAVRVQDRSSPPPTRVPRGSFLFTPAHCHAGFYLPATFGSIYSIHPTPAVRKQKYSINSIFSGSNSGTAHLYRERKYCTPIFFFSAARCRERHQASMHRFCRTISALNCRGDRAVATLLALAVARARVELLLLWFGRRVWVKRSSMALKFVCDAAEGL